MAKSKKFNEGVAIVSIILSSTGIEPKSLTTSLDVLGRLDGLVQTMRNQTILRICSMLRGVLGGFPH